MEESGWFVGAVFSSRLATCWGFLSPPPSFHTTLAYVLKPNSPPAVQSQHVLNLVSNHNLWTALLCGTNTRLAKTLGIVLMIEVRAGNSDWAVTVEFQVCPRRAKITNDFSVYLLLFLTRKGILSTPSLKGQCKCLHCSFCRSSFCGVDGAQHITSMHDLQHRKGQLDFLKDCLGKKKRKKRELLRDNVKKIKRTSGSCFQISSRNCRPCRD